MRFSMGTAGFPLRRPPPRLSLTASNQATSERGDLSALKRIFLANCFDG